MARTNKKTQEPMKAAEVALQDTEPTSDRGDETQRAFRYQNAYGVILLAAGLRGTTKMTALWCEHHEDILVERPDSMYEAYQVKTKSSGDLRIADDDFRKTVRRFAELEAKHGPYIYRYVLVSNCLPYVAAKGTKNEDKIRNSPLKLVMAAKLAASARSIESPFQKTFSELVALGIDETHLFSVLRRLDFSRGPGLNDFEDSIVASHLPGIPGCNRLSVPELAAIRDELIQKVWQASSLHIDGPGKHLDIIGPDGRPASEKKAKRISLEDARFVISERLSYVFRYSSDALEVNYGAGKSKMAVLREKMNYGGVGQHFPYVEAKAIAAEERLMEQGVSKPEEALERIGQIEKVVLSECHEANIEAEMQPEEKRGITMLSSLVSRFRVLSKSDPQKVLEQPYEVLVGLAGLLSGECKVWWGVPLPKETAHES